MNNMIFAIDPGPVESGWIITRDGIPFGGFGKDKNDLILQKMPLIRASNEKIPWVLAIERVSSMGMAVGEEVFETVFWSGRFYQAFIPSEVIRVSRMDVKMKICNNSRAKDANIRAALIDRFGGVQSIKKGGLLYKIAGDVWSALGVAITAQDIIP